MVGTPSARAVAPDSTAPSRGSPRRLVVMGHIDEIGLIVTHIDDEGFLWFREVGGWDAQILVGQRVVLGTRAGELPGVIGKKPIHLLRDEERKKVAEVRDLHIDIGARDGEQARELVRVGDVAVIDGDPVELPNGRIASRALDNRLGSFVALEAARLVAQAGGAAVGAGRRGRRPGGDDLRRLAHQRLLARARRGDRRGRDPRDRCPRDRGEGGGQAPARLGTRAEPWLDAAPPPVRAAARHRGAGGHPVHGRGDRPQHGHRRRRRAPLAAAGVPTALVSVPIRYMHSPVELVALADVHAAARLIAAAARTLGGDASFAR